MIENVETITNHILSLYSSKMLAYVKKDHGQLGVSFEKEKEDGALYIHSSTPGVSAPNGPQHEKR